MGLLNGAVALFFDALAALLFGYLIQRMLGLRLGIIRLLLGGAFAVLLTGPILTGVVSQSALKSYGDRAWWFLLLAAFAVLFASMLFLVVAEAFVPYGSVPPAREWGRGLRGRIRRSRRYFQIVRITIRRGLCRTCGVVAGGRWPPPRAGHGSASHSPPP